MITCEEKWVVSHNVERKHSWGKQGTSPQTIAKINIHAKSHVLYLVGY